MTHNIQREYPNIPEVSDLLRRHNENKETQNGSIRADSWLGKEPPLGDLPITFSLFNLLNNDAFVSGTPFEGENSKNSLNFFIHFLEKVLQNENAELDLSFLEPHRTKLETLLKQYKVAADIAKRIDEITLEGIGKSEKEKIDLIRGYADELRQKFSDAPGWFPGGWRSKNGSHALMIRIDCNRGITIVNTGDGLQYHPQSKHTSLDPLTGECREEGKHQEFLHISGVDPERIRDVDFYQQLLEMKIRSAWQGELKLSSENIYRGTAEFLKGKKEKGVDPNRHPELYKKPQRSGSCAIKCMTTALYYTLCGEFEKGSSDKTEAVQCYKQLKFLWQSQTFVQICRERLAEDLPEAELQLLRDSADNLERAAEKLSLQGLITQERLGQVHVTLEDVRARIENNRTKIAPEQEIRRVDASLEIVGELEKPIQIPEGVREVPFFTQLKKWISRIDREFPHEDRLKNIRGILTEFAEKRRSLSEENIKPFRDECWDISWDIKRNLNLSDSNEDADLYNFIREIYSGFFGKGLDNRIARPSKETIFAKLHEMSQKELPAPGSFMPFFKDWVGALQSKDLAKFSSIAALDTLADVISILPLPGDEYWDEIPEGELLSIMSDSKELIKLINSLVLNQHSFDHTADKTVVVYYFLAIMDRLARRVPETRLDGFPLNYYDLLREVRSEKFILNHPGLQNKLFGLMRYFDPDFNLESTIIQQVNLEMAEARYASCLFSFRYQEGRSATPGILINEDTIKESQTLLYLRQFLDTADEDFYEKLKQCGVEKEDSENRKLEAIAASFVRSRENLEPALLPEMALLLQEAALHAFHCTRGAGSKSTPSISDTVHNNINGKEGITILLRGFDFYQPERIRLYVKDPLLSPPIPYRDQNKILIDDQVLNDWDLETTLEYRMTASDPYDEVNRVISFLRQHPSLASWTRDALFTSFYKPGRLLSQLEDDPEFPAKIGRFFQDILDHYLELRDFETISSLIQMGSEVAFFIQRSGFELRSYPDLHEFLWTKVLDELENQDPMKLEILWARVRAYRSAELKSLKNKEALCFAKDFYSYILLQTLAGEVNDPHVKALEERAVCLFSTLMNENEECKNEILNHILLFALPRENADVWEGEFPIYHSKVFEVNVREGTVRRMGGGELSSLPRDYREHPAYSKIMTTALISCEKLEKRHYILNRGEASELEIIECSRTMTKHFFRKVEGRRYRYIDTPAMLQTNLPSVFDKDLLCWVSEEEPSHILALRDAKPAFRIDYDNDEIKKVMRLSDQKCWVPFDKAPESLKMFNKFEPDPGYILIWGNEELTELRSVELPRLGLQFDVKKRDGQDRFLSRQHPGFQLIERMALQGIPGDLHVLMLANSAGDVKALLPRVEPTSKYDQSFDHLERKVTLPIEKALQKPKPLAWMDYRVKSSKLQSSRLEARLFQALVFLKNGDYDNAKELLKRSYSLKRYTKREEKILSWIFNCLGGGKHPSAHALFLWLAIQVGKNHLKYPLAIGEEEKKWLEPASVLKKYLSYMENQSNAPHHRLTLEEEQELIQLLESLNEREELPREDEKIGERKRFLQQGTARLGHRNVLQLNSKPSLPHKNISGELKRKLEAWTPDAVNFELMPLIIPSRIIKERFFDLYQIATEGEPRKREQLLRRLEFLSGEQLERDEYFSLLRDAVRRPSLYPKIDKFKELNFSQIHSYLKKSQQVNNQFDMFPFIEEKVAKIFSRDNYRLTKPTRIPSIAVRCDSTSLKEADQWFNEYFEGIRDRYFKVNVEEQKIDEIVILPEVEDANLNRRIREENKELETYRRGLAAKRIFEPKKDLEEMGRELREKAENLQASLKSHKSALLWQLNQVSETSKKVHRAGLRQKCTWKDLQRISQQGDLGPILAATEMDETQANAFLMGVAAYLVKASRLHQMRKVLEGLDKASAIKEKSRRHQVLQEVGAALECIRRHDPDPAKQRPLWFEYANQYLYRKEQLDKLVEIDPKDGEEILAEMPTGFGKTKTLIPSHNQEKAAEGRHVVNTWPASLEMVNAEDVREQMERGYGKKVDRFAFDRSTAFSTESLKFLYEELQRGLQEGTPLNVKSETLRALELHMILSLSERGQKPKKELDEQIGYMIKILRFFRTQSVTIIDEAHQTLDPMDKLIYTLGKSQQLPKEQLDFFEELFSLITQEPINTILRIRENRQALVTEDGYKRVAEHIQEHFRAKWGIEKNVFEAFLAGGSAIPEWVERHTEKESLCLLKGVLANVLPECLKNYVDEKYGLSKLHIKTKEYAISYLHSNTPKETALCPSQFKNPHETMIKTYLTYLYHGLSVDQVQKLVRHLKEEAKREMEEGVPLSRTQANTLFHELIPDAPKMLSWMSERDVEQIAERIRKNQGLIFFYIRNLIAPQVKIYPKILTSSVQNYRSQFQASVSLTATPPDAASHGPDTRFVPMKGTSGQVTHLLLTKPKNIHIVDAVRPQEVLEKTLKIASQDRKVRAAIDLGAQFKGLTNQQIADRICRQYQEDEQIAAVLYYDEEQKNFMVMDTRTKSIHDPRDIDLDPDQRVTYYDQGRSVGSDIKQAVDSAALLMMGQKTTKAAAGQGAGRMRQWHLEQGTDWIIPQEIADRIAPGGKPTPMQILLFLLDNQVKEEAQKNYQAQLQQMDNEIRRVLIDKMLGVKENAVPSIKSAAGLFIQFQQELLSNDTLLPSLLYGALPQEQDTRETLLSHQRTCLEKVERLKGLSRQEKDALRERLNLYAAKWDEMALPEKVKSGAGLGMECEVLQEVEVETQVEMQAQVQEKLELRKSWNWPENLNLFEKGWETPKKSNQFLDGASSKLQQLGRFIKREIEKSTGPNASVLRIVCFTTLIGLPVYASVIAIYVKPIFIVHYAVFAAAAGICYYVYSKTVATSDNLAPKIHVQKNCLVWRWSEVMNRRLPQIRGASFFSPHLLVSNNFSTQKTEGLLEMKQTPFDRDQKPLFEVLVIEDEGKNVQLMLIDQNDSIEFRRMLKTDQSTSEVAAAKRTRKVAIYDLQNGIIAHGKNQFDSQKLEKNPQFQKLLAEAKFINGELRYTKEELEHIEAQAKKAGIGNMQKLFKDHILARRTVNKSSYSRSRLAAVLGV